MSSPPGQPFAAAQGPLVETFAVERAKGFEGCDHDFHPTVNKNHGHIETRRCRVIGAPEYLRSVDPNGLWPDLHSLIVIEAQRRQGDGPPRRPATTFPSCRRMRGNCRGPCAATGGQEPPAPGPGHDLPGGQEPHPHRPCRPQHVDPTRMAAAYCAARLWPRTALPPNASSLAGMTGTSPWSCQVSIQLSRVSHKT